MQDMMFLALCDTNLWIFALFEISNEPKALYFFQSQHFNSLLLDILQDTFPLKKKIKFQIRKESKPSNHYLPSKLLTVNQSLQNSVSQMVWCEGQCGVQNQGCLSKVFHQYDVKYRKLGSRSSLCCLKATVIPHLWRLQLYMWRSWRWCPLNNDMSSLLTLLQNPIIESVPFAVISVIWSHPNQLIGNAQKIKIVLGWLCSTFGNHDLKNQSWPEFIFLGKGGKVCLCSFLNNFWREFPSHFGHLSTLRPK